MRRLVLTLAILAGFALGGVAQSLNFDFEDGTLQGWTVLDGDGDGHCWEPSIGGMGHNSNGMVMAYSKDYATGDSLAPNEYLVSPRLVLSEDWPVINFYACALDEIYPAEHFGVSISTTVNDDPLAFTLLSQWTIAAKDAGNRQGNWYNYTVDLSAYTGQEVYVAIRHHYCSGQSAICVDDITIYGTLQQDGLVITPDTLWFENNTTQMVTITNESNEAVVLSEFNQPSNAYPYATLYYESQPIYNVLPLTLQPNQSIEVAIFFVEPPYPGKSDYVSSYIDIVSTVGNKRITLMASESIFGGLLCYWDIWLDGTNPEPEVVYNYYLSDITINDIYEVGTDFLIIETAEPLPVSLPMGSGFDFTVRLRENLKGYVDTQICVSTSQGDSFIPVHISIANGILTRVPAPYFEQNACDTRLAIVSGEETFYVTVDGFWPNPNLDALVVRYDTIPIGTAIDVSGTIKTMSDELGNPFYVIDIQETTAHYYDAITSMLKGWPEEYVYIQPTVSPSQIYYLTINGERQTWPLVFNGVTYEDFDLLTFIGHCGIQTDSIGNEFMGMELQDIQPFRDYTFELEDGTLSTNYWNPLYLSAPLEDQHFLTFLWGDFTFPSTFYPMHNGQFYKGSFINNDIFREGMHVDLKGIEHIRYDIYGSEVNTVEIVEMDTEEETTLTGTVEMAPIPNTGNNPLPVPGVMVAFKANERTYYLENPQDYSGSEWFLVGNDTIYSGQEITATFTSKMLIDNGLNFYYRININEAEVLDPILPPGAEWYYEIQNDNGSITYQYLYQAGDTIVQDEPTHILVKINTLYDKDLHQDVTHEYVYERDGKVYWWNKTLEEFTVLYDFGAQEGDEWEIKVGNESLVMHVDAVENIEYEGKTYMVLHVSDADDYFSGDIVCGIGHLTSFFPERLMDNGDGLRVEGLRCYWVEDELVFKPGDEDCDAIYSEVHGVEEDGPSTGSGTFAVYPNPTNGVLAIHHSEFRIHHSEFQIANLMGQTLLTGQITTDNQQIDVSSLPQGMYFITFAGETRKFVVR